MRPIRTVMLAVMALIAPAISHAEAAGSTVVGVAAAELRDVTLGWSAERTILGQPVFNDKNERVGSIDDIIVAPDKAVSSAPPAFLVWRSMMLPLLWAGEFTDIGGITHG